MPPVKALSIDSWEEPTKPDPFARLMPFAVEVVAARARSACQEARAHYSRAEALFDEVDEMLK